MFPCCFPCSWPCTSSWYFMGFINNLYIFSRVFWSPCLERTRSASLRSPPRNINICMHFSHILHVFCYPGCFHFWKSTCLDLLGQTPKTNTLRCRFIIVQGPLASIVFNDFPLIWASILVPWGIDFPRFGAAQGLDFEVLRPCSIPYSFFIVFFHLWASIFLDFGVPLGLDFR